jgi:hypothetical protein
MAAWFFSFFLIPILLAFPNTSVAADAGNHSRVRDHREFFIARQGLIRAVEFARSRPELFAPGKREGGDLISRGEKMLLWTTWSSVLDSEAALDALRRGDNGFAGRGDHLQFNLGHASFLAGYRYALEFIALTDKNPQLDTVLNDAVPELGLPAGTFGRFKLRFLNAAIATEFAALQVIAKGHVKGPPALMQAIAADSRVIWEMGKGKGHALTMKNALAVVQKAGFVAWFPVQKGVSQWMGDTKVLRKGEHLITGKQVAAAGTRLQPGDIIFERHEWYLSNMGLPGFWTHVALYVGTPGERRKFFNDRDFREWVKTRGDADGDFEKLLGKRFPAAYERGTTPLEDGHPPRIIEAISEGVSFTSLEFTGAADSIAIVRPRLDRIGKAQAIMRAFHYSGRPYDFNFDFATDSELVCSELLFKAYEPGPQFKGILFPVSEVLGRKVSTPNSMVRQFDELSGTPAAQADFVLFLDGYERGRRAVESTIGEFRRSWQRPNWHILIQEKPGEAAQGK